MYTESGSRILELWVYKAPIRNSWIWFQILIDGRPNYFPNEYNFDEDFRMVDI